MYEQTYNIFGTTCFILGNPRLTTGSQAQNADNSEHQWFIVVNLYRPLSKQITGESRRLYTLVETLNCHGQKTCQEAADQSKPKSNLMTSSNGIIFRVTGPLCGELPSRRPVTRSFDVFCDLDLSWMMEFVYQRPFLLTWNNFNLSVDEQLHPLYKV